MKTVSKTNVSLLERFPFPPGAVDVVKFVISAFFFLHSLRLLWRPSLFLFLFLGVFGVVPSLHDKTVQNHVHILY